MQAFDPWSLVCLSCTITLNKMEFLDEYQNTPQVLASRSFLVAGFDTRWEPRRVSCGIPATHHVLQLLCNTPRAATTLQHTKYCNYSVTHKMLQLLCNLTRDMQLCNTLETCKPATHKMLQLLCNTLETCKPATHKMLQHTKCCNTQNAATHKMLQHTKCCNTRNTATHKILQPSRDSGARAQHDHRATTKYCNKRLAATRTTSCNTLQHTATHCNTLQHTSQHT